CSSNAAAPGRRSPVLRREIGMFCIDIRRPTDCRLGGSAGMYERRWCRCRWLRPLGSGYSIEYMLAVEHEVEPDSLLLPSDEKSLL
ncbi:hypothetical protein IWW47_004418, partial [Coemansia sp. RSA 2052]